MHIWICKLNILGDANATYGGIFGHLLADNYDRSYTAWQHTLERNSRAEFSISCIHIKAHVVMDVAKAGKHDWTLYFRPFDNNLWLENMMTFQCRTDTKKLIVPVKTDPFLFRVLFRRRFVRVIHIQ